MISIFLYFWSLDSSSIFKCFIRNRSSSFRIISHCIFSSLIIVCNLCCSISFNYKSFFSGTSKSWSWCQLSSHSRITCSCMCFCNRFWWYRFRFYSFIYMMYFIFSIISCCPICCITSISYTSCSNSYSHCRSRQFSSCPSYEIISNSSWIINCKSCLYIIWCWIRC